MEDILIMSYPEISGNLRHIRNIPCSLALFDRAHDDEAVDLGVPNFWDSSRWAVECMGSIHFGVPIMFCISFILRGWDVVVASVFGWFRFLLGSLTLQ